jgi:hypothetical protein
MYYPIYKQKGNILTLEIRKEDIQESVNTRPDQFKIIEDVKDEPTFKVGSRVCWWICGRHINFLTVII